MHRALLLAAVLLSAACVETPPPPPPRRVPDAVFAPQPARPAPPTASVPVARPPSAPTSRVNAPRADAQPALDPAAESSRIARAIDGVAIASSRTGRHRFRIDQVVQRVRGTSVTMEFQVHLVPGGADVLLGRVLPVRRFVTTDGFELASPEQSWGVDSVAGRIATQGIGLAGRRHRGLRNLDLDARIYEVRERATFSAGPFGAGEHEARLGPFPVSVAVGAEGLTITAWNDPAAARTWNASHRQPLPDSLDFSWVLDSVDVRDRSGATAMPMDVDLEGGVGTARYVFVDASDLAPVTPVTVSLGVPTSYRREDTSLYFADLPFTTVEED